MVGVRGSVSGGFGRQCQCVGGGVMCGCGRGCEVWVWEGV